MKSRLFIVIILLATTNVNAELVKASTINDPEKQRICLSRSIFKNNLNDDFLIERKYVEIVRKYNPDATFVAVKPESPTLITCYLRSGTGKFEPASYQGINNNWKLIKPDNPIDINTIGGKRMATKVCIDAIASQLNRKEIFNIIPTTTNEILRDSGVRYSIGSKVGDVIANRYDVISDGEIIFNRSSNGLDKDSKKYKCLMDPSFKVKGIEMKAP